jgi:hypothetical protein
MGGGSGAQPHAPSAFLAGIGKGVFGRSRHVAILERHGGEVWREIGRFGSVRDANVALDEAVANGDAPDSFRVMETHVGSNGLLVLAGVIAIAAAIAIVAYVILS